MWFATIASLIVAALVYKVFFRKKQNFWEEHGIRYINTSPAMSFMDLLRGRKPMFAAEDYVYEQLGSEKFAGVMSMGKPVMVVKDVELLKKIFIKDFDHFTDRRDFFSDKDSTISRMLPSLQGDEWKGVRAAVSPTFTTGKIRRVMEFFNSVGKEWVDDLRDKAKTSGTGSVTLKIAKSANQYTIDVIASAVFGFNAGTIKDPTSTFYKMALQLTALTKKQLIKFVMFFTFPKLCNLFRISLFDKTALNFFEAILDQGLQVRMKGEVKRNDFLQLLVEAKKGELKGMGNDELNTFEKEAQLSGDDKKRHLTDKNMSAQGLVFFFAGYSTTSNLITFVAYNLAAYQEVQDKLRTEVTKIAKEDGTFDYDELGQLVYLDMVICEVNRKFPTGGKLERKCVKDYKDSETGLFIPKDVMVSIPVNALHHDKQYYDNPHGFDPEHFSPDKKAERNPYVYLPFGMGPRNCIGMRFALTEAKAAIAHLVLNFRIEPSEKTPLPVHGIPAGLQLAPPKKLELKLTPI